ncbi:MAG: cytosine permease [Corynebacterium sp.]|nr:cytosine permease [Corynebacterium sp.]
MTALVPKPDTTDIPDTTHTPATTQSDPDVSVHGAETRGIEYITEDERGGHPGSLFWVWATPNISFLTITLGAVLVAGLGLSLWQALAVTVIANLGWILVGILAVSGPAAGTSGSVITRAMYGIRGNKIIVGLYGWLLSAVYLSLTWSAASVNGVGLLNRFGVPSGVAVDVAVVIVISGVTALVGIYGHGLITRLYPYVANALAVVFLLATAFMIPHFDLSYRPTEQLGGMELAAAMSIGVTILASAPLSFFNSPDMARYLPSDTPKWKTAAATGCGGASAGIIFTMVGALIATGAGFDMIGDPLGAFEAAMPSWFFPVFTLGVIVAAIGLNGMTTYSASLSLQALGIPLKRIPSTLIITVIGTLLTVVSVAVYDFTTSVSLLLQLIVIASGPLITVFATDVVLRRNRYDGPTLLDDSPHSPFWFRDGWNWNGLASVSVGGVAALLCISTDVFVGPVSSLTGMDLSIPAGIAVSALVYTVLYRNAPTSR